MSDKAPVKMIVIACNTATAYGKSDIERFLHCAGLDIKVIGVIDAGVKAALDEFEKDENGTIAVMATAGTVSSNGYVNAIKSQMSLNSYKGDIAIVQQAGIGLAGAIDGSHEYIAPAARKPRTDYQGPGRDATNAIIDASILNRYGFGWDNNHMLFDGGIENPRNIQINSVDNYISYHLVSLMEQIRNSGSENPLKAIILGCTHYPFFEKVFKQKLQRLYNYKEDGQYVYRMVMAPHIKLIDPARNTAKETYEYLKHLELFNSSDLSKSEFYISIPNRTNPSVQLDSSGNFTYEYKYGRDVGIIQEYVIRVPFSRRNILSETATRLESGVPVTSGLIRTFNRTSSKLGTFEAHDKF
jgi:glutamate racemase